MSQCDNREIILEKVNRMYADKDAKLVFDSKEVYQMTEELLRKYLVEYKVALQQNKQPLIWKRICETIENKLDVDIRNLFVAKHNSILVNLISRESIFEIDG